MQFILITFIFCLSCLNCQDFKAYSVENYNSIDGLSQNNIQSIIQDQTGFIWFGTRKGLNRFDGNKIKRFDTDNPLSNYHIRKLFLGSNGVIWIGTDGGGLLSFDPVTEKVSTYLYKNSSNQFVSTYAVLTIAEGKNNRIYVGTVTHGLLLLDRGQNILTSFNHPENKIRNKTVYSLLNDSKNRIWLGTEKDGVFLYNPIKNSWHSYTEKNGLSSNNIRAIYEDSKNTVFIGSTNGLNTYNEQSDRFYYPKKNNGLIITSRGFNFQVQCIRIWKLNPRIYIWSA